MGGGGGSCGVLLIRLDMFGWLVVGVIGWAEEGL
jgi:hypothetical protein